MYNLKCTHNYNINEKTQMKCFVNINTNNGVEKIMSIVATINLRSMSTVADYLSKVLQTKQRTHEVSLSFSCT